MKYYLFLRAAYSTWFAETAPEGTDPFSGLLTSLAALLVIVLIILIVWWLLRARTGQVEPVEHEDHDEHAAHAEAAPVEAPAAGPDDLKVIEGIGPKVQSVLNTAGITTFAQLADAAVEALQETLDAAGYRYMNPASWPEQARLAAAGEWDALKQLQDELNAGRSK